VCPRRPFFLCAGRAAAHFLARETNETIKVIMFFVFLREIPAVARCAVARSVGVGTRTHQVNGCSHVRPLTREIAHPTWMIQEGNQNGTSTYTTTLLRQQHARAGGNESRGWQATHPASQTQLAKQSEPRAADVSTTQWMPHIQCRTSTHLFSRLPAP